MKNITIPNLHGMQEDEIKNWVSTLTTPDVYANLKQLTEAIMDRLGHNARIATYSFHPPKVVYLLDD